MDLNTKFLGIILDHTLHWNIYIYILMHKLSIIIPGANLGLGKLDSCLGR